MLNVEQLTFALTFSTATNKDQRIREEQRCRLSISTVSIISYFIISLHTQHSVPARPQTNSRSPTRTSLRYEARDRRVLLSTHSCRSPFPQCPWSFLFLFFVQPRPCSLQFHIFRCIHPRPSSFSERTSPRRYRRSPTSSDATHRSRPSCPRKAQDQTGLRLSRPGALWVWRWYRRGSQYRKLRGQ